MKTKMIAWTAVAVVLVWTATFFAADIKTDYDRSADFNSYKTYSWEKVQTRDPLWVDRIRSAVDSQLAVKGWTRMNSGGQVAVIAIEMTRDQRTLNTFYDNFGRGWRWGGGLGTATTTMDTYKVGTLVVDMFDANTKKLIWRGSSSDTLSDNSDKNIKNLDKDVQRMFEHFPPEVKK